MQRIQKNAKAGDGVGDETPTGGATRWWAIHTLPRCEKKLDQWFNRQGMEHYLPLRRSVRVYASKKAVFHLPLFPGYAFGAFSPLERRSVLQSRFVAKTLGVEDQEQFRIQLANIRRAIESEVAMEACAYLKEGTRVRITSGKLRGLEGFVLRFHGKSRLILSVDILQRSVALEVDPFMVTVYA